MVWWWVEESLPSTPHRGRTQKPPLRAPRCKQQQQKKRAPAAWLQLAVMLQTSMLFTDTSRAASHASNTLRIPKRASIFFFFFFLTSALKEKKSSPFAVLHWHFCRRLGLRHVPDGGVYAGPATAPIVFFTLPTSPALCFAALLACGRASNAHAPPPTYTHTPLPLPPRPPHDR